MPRGMRYAPEFRAEAIRLYKGSGKSIRDVASDLGIAPESLRRWVTQSDIDAGDRAGLTTEEREELKALRGEVRELRRANDILKSASAFFAAELDPRRAR